MSGRHEKRDVGQGPSHRTTDIVLVHWRGVGGETPNGAVEPQALSMEIVRQEHLDLRSHDQPR